MAIPDSFLQELRNRITLSDLVGRKVTWDRKKSNFSRRDYWAPCPFHSEKTASFHVQDGEGRYYCFGCHAAGDAVKWLMESEGLPFREAVEQLAEQAGLPMPQESREERQRAEVKRTLVDALEIAARWFENSLWAEDTGKPGRDYLMRQRGLSADTLRKFRLGLAPNDPDMFLTAMERNGLTVKLLQDAGLMTQGDPAENRAPVPYFRNRVMFPILDQAGKVIAFGGRDLSGKSRAKYLNSPETAAFSKSHVLYNFQAARTASRKAGTIIVSEGYMDVIALDRGGFSHAVAPLGTALTESQLGMLWRSVAEPVLAFDGDKAGINAAYRSARLALPMLEPGRSLRFAFMPEGKDPDDVLNAGGRSALEDLLAKPKPLVDVLWRSLKADADLSTPEARAGFEQECSELVNQIKNGAVRTHYAAAIEARIEAEFGRSSHMVVEEGRGPAQNRAGGDSRSGGEGGGSGGNAYRRRDENDPWEAPGVEKKWVKKGFRRVLKDVGASDVARRSRLVTAQIEGRAKIEARSLRDKRLLTTILQWPEVAENHLEQLAEFHFADPTLDKLYAATLDNISQTSGISRAELQRDLTDQGFLDDIQRLERAAGNSVRSEQGRFSVGVPNTLDGALRQMSALLAQLEVAAAESAVREATAALEQDPSDEAFARLISAKQALEDAHFRAQHEN